MSVLCLVERHVEHLPGPALIAGWDDAVVAPNDGLFPVESGREKRQTLLFDGTHLFGQLFHRTARGYAQELVEGVGVEAHSPAKFVQGSRSQVIERTLPDVWMNT